MGGHNNALDLLLGGDEDHGEVQNVHKATTEYRADMRSGINFKDNNRCTPLDLAVVFNRENAVQVLWNIHNPKENSWQMIVSFGIAVMLGHTGIVKLMVSQVNDRAIASARIFAEKL
ncbi:hypothetical protein K440DRAFT_592043 [Wilcoxina mikolae CBS 423.85]|nr:hypothetical protein K440DRAFT_592043 [Wilcoxina mikolae CBS 423.85]